MRYDQVISKLRSQSNPKNVEGMKRFGISTKNTLGISVVALRGMAKSIGKDHEMAERLWSSGIHEARILAPMIEELGKVTDRQMDGWVRDFDSWDICDQCCGNLFDKTPYAYEKAFEWSKDKSEFVKRAGYVMMAALAVHDKAAGDEKFVEFLKVIKKGADDERNFVKKAVNWALRQIGKRNKRLNRLAIETANEIKVMDSSSARWIASDALRELTSSGVKERL
jgi:3-methyladenine DNA glycosylase AlkD